MRKILILCALALPAVPAVAVASGGSERSTAQKQCRAERDAMGAATFKQAYGTNRNRSNAFGKCVSHREQANAADESRAHANAAKQCKAERQADPAAFRAQWGTGKKGADALGRCVSARAKSQADHAERAQVKAEVNAARACRKERAADPAAFKAKYGTNGNKSNAFGRCVSRKAKAQGQQTGS